MQAQRKASTKMVTCLWEISDEEACIIRKALTYYNTTLPVKDPHKDIAIKLADQLYDVA